MAAPAAPTQYHTIKHKKRGKNRRRRKEAEGATDGKAQPHSDSLFLHRCCCCCYWCLEDGEHDEKQAQEQETCCGVCDARRPAAAGERAPTFSHSGMLYLIKNVGMSVCVCVSRVKVLLRSGFAELIVDLCSCIIIFFVFCFLKSSEHFE